MVQGIDFNKLPPLSSTTWNTMPYSKLDKLEIELFYLKGEVTALTRTVEQLTKSKSIKKGVRVSIIKWFAKLLGVSEVIK